MAKDFLTTQSLISVKEIRRGIIILKNGSLRSVLQVSGINMDLKSLEEQNIILTGWRTLLNNLDFPLEVICHSRRVNIESYLTILTERIKKETNELLKIQGEDYYSFISGLVSENKIMTKKFFLVVPYDPIKIEVKSFLSDLLQSFKEMFQIKTTAFSATKPLSDEEFNQYYQQLLIRQGIIINTLTRIGVEVRAVSTKEIIEILYNLYNPETFEREFKTDLSF